MIISEASVAAAKQADTWGTRGGADFNSQDSRVATRRLGLTHALVSMSSTRT